MRKSWMSIVLPCISRATSQDSCRCWWQGLPIFSKRYYTAYDFSQSTLTAPLGSGAYKVGRHAVGRFVEYHRVEDYWGNDLPVLRGSEKLRHHPR